MNYQDTLNWMFTQLPMYQNIGKGAFKKDLSNSLLFSKHLNYPERSFKSVHVAGTNGKGSTSHMIASILQEAGLKVGLYTSPHLKDFRERIKINGVPISENEVVEFISENQSFFKDQYLSFFEMTVGLAFDCFSKHKVDIAIVEVGLGGRLDSTNIINPLISVITNIGLDHTQMLGETLPEIALEKAGIIKRDVPVVIGEFQEDIHHLFYEKALKNNSSLFLAEKNITKRYSSDLKGSYQLKNIKTAVQSILLLEDFGFVISEDNISNGLLKIVESTGLFGRWQVLGNDPLIVCDTAHNPNGLKYVFEQLLHQQYEKLHVVLGVVNDKDLDEILSMFPKEANYYYCKPNIPRGLNEEDLKSKGSAFELKGNSFNSVKSAFEGAKSASSSDDLIFVGGSTFVVAEVI